ncbi:HAMP domain-containing protein [Sphingomonas populi]|uniref:histidine kinase n=1 Tax=Sphingomonas populi TaxID=2484750 RepID=A0A4Q6XRV6_9SPHN|nr:ATP-binding protein [Sphingomonas populi]RZF63173.1 HAMP domain-containing protein [Sphingomonas populi]
MTLARRISLGLLGRLLVILLLTIVVEFGASTLLYERASELSLREDEANRLAEHLVVSRKLLNEWPADQRVRIARELATDRYRIGWSPVDPNTSTFRPQLGSMQGQILAWEPDLARSNLRLRLPALHQDGSTVLGDLQLADGSWMTFQMRGITSAFNPSYDRILRALLPAILLAMLAGLLIRSTLRPLRGLIRASHHVGLGLRGLIRASHHVGLGLRAPIVEEGSAEIRSLIHAFNEMQDRIHELIESRTQALAAVGHDLRTPLARLHLRLEGIEDDALRGELAEDVAEMSEMLGSLLAFFGGQSDPEKPALADLAVLVATLVDNAADRGLDATYDGPDHFELRVRASAMRRAIANLIENALHYGERARVRLEADATRVCVIVEDDGPGIPPERIRDVLTPFVRLDEARARNTKGMGLGLAIVASAVEAEGGTLTLANRAGGGLTATILLKRNP